MVLTNPIKKAVSWFKESFDTRSVAEKAATIQPNFSEYKSEAYATDGYSYTPVIHKNFTGEKNFGELGTAISYSPDYQILALRSWQAYTESEIAKLVIDNYVLWVVGTGLRLQSDPKARVLKMENVTLTEKDLAEFTGDVESRFKLHAESRFSSHSRLSNLHLLAQECQKNAIISGDCLVILRYFKNGGLNIQLIDGQKIITPPEKEIAAAKVRGNSIKHGVEVSKKGGHIAFFIRDADTGKVIRIPAKGVKTGRTSAFLVYGTKYRLDYTRGLPLIAVVLETMKKLDRYKEATVGSAEERQKIALVIQHQLQAEGDNPFAKDIINSRNLNGEGVDEDDTIGINKEAARRIAATTGKTAVNLAPGSELKSLESKNELYFKEFYETNIDIVCAALGIPPEVALMKYTSSFSAARMATESWGFSLKVKRYAFSFEFYKPYYNLWLQMEILRGKLKAPKYIENISKPDKTVILAYESSRFIGPKVPHVDPVKEVKAELLKLGESKLALSNHQQSAEHLGLGEWEDNIKKYNKEQEEFGIPEPEPIEPIVNN